MGNCTSSGGGGGNGSLRVKEGGGFQYTTSWGDGKERTFTFQQINGKTYNVSNLADIPKLFGNGASATELANRIQRNGKKVTVLSPEQIQARKDARNAERELRNKIDYELGAGVPWGNKANRQAARRGRLASRVAKRRR